MTSKLRRAPLFTYNDMGTRCLAASFAGGAPPPHPGGHHPGGHHPGHPGAPAPGPHPGQHPGHHQAGYGQHGYREAPPPPLPYKKKPQPPLPVSQQQQSGVHCVHGAQAAHSVHSAHQMECGVAGVAGVAGSLAASGAPSPLLGASLADRSRPERSPAKHGLHVNFTEKVEVKERREKFLTAKYGSHQMALIRKRLAVEMWLYDELQKLYESTENNKNDEVDVDIDELLDMDDDNQRRIHLQRILADAKKSSHDVKKFVEDLLERTKTL